MQLACEFPVYLLPHLPKGGSCSRQLPIECTRMHTDFICYRSNRASQRSDHGFQAPMNLRDDIILGTRLELAHPFFHEPVQQHIRAGHWCTQ